MYYFFKMCKIIQCKYLSYQNIFLLFTFFFVFKKSYCNCGNFALLVFDGLHGFGKTSTGFDYFLKISDCMWYTFLASQNFVKFNVYMGLKLNWGWLDFGTCYPDGGGNVLTFHQNFWDKQISASIALIHKNFMV